jgi:hypothetical protein
VVRHSKLPVFIFDPLARLGQLQPVVGALHDFEGSPFQKKSKLDECNAYWSKIQATIRNSRVAMVGGSGAATEFPNGPYQ